MLETLLNLLLIGLALLMVAWFFSAPKTVLVIGSLLAGAYAGTMTEHSVLGTLVGLGAGGAVGALLAGAWAALSQPLGWSLVRVRRLLANDSVRALADRFRRLDPMWVYSLAVMFILTVMLVIVLVANAGLPGRRP